MVTEPKEVPSCPSCGRASVSHKTGTPVGAREHPEDWYCRYCSTHFDDPVYREHVPAQNPAGRSATVRALMDADPDDIGGDA